MGRIILETSYLRTTGRLGSMATDSDGGPQPLFERDYESSPERGVIGVPAASGLPLPSFYE